MTKRELIEKLAERVKDLSLKDAEIIVNTVFDTMTEALSTGDRIEIRGFGSFQVKERRSREGRNPRTGDKVAVASKRVPFFKVGKELKERADQE